MPDPADRSRIASPRAMLRSDEPFMSSDLRDIRPSTGILMGGAFLLAGLAILRVALGWIEMDPSRIHAPSWVIGVSGAMFALAGAGVLYQGVVNGLEGTAEGARERGEFSVLGWLLGLVISAGMTSVASWIAFGPGERAFSRSIGIGGIGVHGSGGSEALGRWVFGIGAVLTGAFTLWGLIYGLRRLTGREKR